MKIIRSGEAGYYNDESVKAIDTVLSGLPTRRILVEAYRNSIVAWARPGENKLWFSLPCSNPVENEDEFIEGPTGNMYHKFIIASN